MWVLSLAGGLLLTIPLFANTDYFESDDSITWPVRKFSNLFSYFFPVVMFEKRTNLFHRGRFDARVCRCPVAFVESGIDKGVVFLFFIFCLIGTDYYRFDSKRRCLDLGYRRMSCGLASFLKNGSRQNEPNCFQNVIEDGLGKEGKNDPGLQILRPNLELKFILGLLFSAYLTHPVSEVTYA